MLTESYINISQPVIFNGKYYRITKISGEEIKMIDITSPSGETLTCGSFRLAEISKSKDRKILKKLENSFKKKHPDQPLYAGLLINNETKIK